MKLWNGVLALLLFPLVAQGMKEDAPRSHKDLFLCGECKRILVDRSAFKKIAGVVCKVCLPCWQKNEDG